MTTDTVSPTLCPDCGQPVYQVDRYYRLDRYREVHDIDPTWRHCGTGRVECASGGEKDESDG